MLYEVITVTDSRRRRQAARSAVGALLEGAQLQLEPRTAVVEPGLAVLDEAGQLERLGGHRGEALDAGGAYLDDAELGQGRQLVAALLPPERGLAAVVQVEEHLVRPGRGLAQALGVGQAELYPEAYPAVEAASP